MANKEPSDRNTKAEILSAYKELVKEKNALKTEVQKMSRNKAEIVVTQQPSLPLSNTLHTEALVARKMNQIIENLSKIQLGFGSAVSSLSEELTSQASQLQEIQKKVADETSILQGLHKLKLEENTLETLFVKYDNDSKTFTNEFDRRQETLQQEIQERVKAWQKEREEHQVAVKEAQSDRQKTKERETAAYKYNVELERQQQADTDAQQQKGIDKELAELQEVQQKAWSERENSVAETEKLYAEAKAKVESLPKEKETALKKATEEGKGIAYHQTKSQADLYAKEVEGQKQFYQQRLQSLEQSILTNEGRISSLSKQLESALKQVQDLAVKAIEGASNVNSYQAMKEIALEQAKNQLKGK
jgi:hypothetical protein